MLAGKIFKISGYIVTRNKSIGNSDIIEGIEKNIIGIKRHFHVTSAPTDDQILINSIEHDKDCDLALLETPFINARNADKEIFPSNKAPFDVIPGETYRHFKGKTVKVVGVFQNSEVPGTYMVAYDCGDHGLWVRPFEMFTSKTPEKYKDKYPQEYRFERVIEE